MKLRGRALRRPARMVGLAFRRGTRPAVVTCVLLVVLAIIAVSPLSLKLVAMKRGINWIQLSNIGQAYGAISAVLSGLALLAVSVSIRLQAREHLANRRQIHRDIHMRLTEMAMADPELMQAWSPDDMSFEQNRQSQYVNLMITFWFMQWEMGEFDDEVLYAIASAQLFQGEPGRRYWRLYRNRWESESLGSHLNRFCKILDDALASVPESMPATRPKVAPLPRHRRREARSAAALGTIVVVGGVIAGSVLRRRRGYRPSR